LLLYYITDRSQFSGDEASRRKKLLQKITEAAECGVDFIQLREKDLSSRELVTLAQEAIRLIREIPASPTHLLINSRTDVAIAAGADGVHLRSVDISPKDVRGIWSFRGDRSLATPSAVPVITVACHQVSDVILAAKNGSSFVLFGSIFEKRKDSQFSTANAVPAGLELLRQACRQEIPVIALGGITPENARSCIDAGAVGIAGIRLFQENRTRDVVHALR